MKPAGLKESDRVYSDVSNGNTFPEIKFDQVEADIANASPASAVSDSSIMVMLFVRWKIIDEHLRSEGSLSVTSSS